MPFMSVDVLNQTSPLPYKEHNHFDLLRSTVYHNNILPHAASTLDHSYTLPVKGTRNTALMSVSAELEASVATHSKWCPDT